MTIYTASGIVKGSKRDPYIKFLSGFVATDAFSGRFIVDKAWEYAKDTRPAGCSWYAYGVIIGRVFE